jgi:hypothetical protein
LISLCLAQNATSAVIGICFFVLLFIFVLFVRDKNVFDDQTKMAELWREIKHKLDSNSVLFDQLSKIGRIVNKFIGGRVTRLGEFSPNRRWFTLCRYFEN